jgi:WhiB family transcriptional regulator, redox-sensing transcriptional regulator
VADGFVCFRAKSLSERFDLSIGTVYAVPVTPTAFTPSAAPIAPAAPFSPTGPAATTQPHLSIVDATWNNLSWRAHASCANLDTNVFFPVGLTGNAIEQTNLAKTICNDCPVAKQCLEFALRTLQDYGVWGGRTEDERRAIRRARRAAARKVATAAAASALAEEEALRGALWQVAGS